MNIVGETGLMSKDMALFGHEEAQCAAEVAASQDPHCRRGQSQQALATADHVLPVI